MSLFLSRAFYFIWQHSLFFSLVFLVLLFFVFLFLGLWIYHLFNFMEKGATTLGVFLLVLYVISGAAVLSTFSNVFQKELDKYTHTVTYSVENYRIQKMKKRSGNITYYLLKTNKGIKIIDEDSFEIREEDRFADKKHKIGRVMTYTGREIKGNVPKYKRKVLENKIKAYKSNYIPEYQSIFKIITYKSEKVD